MAERPIEADLTKTGSASNKITDDDKQLTEATIPKLSREERRRQLVEIYERGVVGDRLRVELPDDIVGQWVPNDTVEKNRMLALGYRIDTEFAPKRKLHDKGDGASYVGDVVHMIADKETREIIDEIKADRYARMNDPKRQKEEADFAAQNRANEGVGIGTLNESKAHRASKAEIEKALDKT